MLKHIYFSNHKNPHVFNFFGTVYINEDTALPEELKEKINEMRNMGYAKLFSNIDRSLFRDDVSHEHIIKLIHWSMNGFSEEIIQDFKGRKLSSVDLDPYWDAEGWRRVAHQDVGHRDVSYQYCRINPKRKKNA